MTRIFKILTLTFLTLFISSSSFCQTSGPEHQSLVSTFFNGFKWGFIAVLQPCLYAMFPVTVSFFLKRSSSRAEGIKNALIYSISIVVIFTVLGLLLTILFGRDTLYEVSSHPIFNLFVFALFMVFGISFLGAFEIVLPSAWTNKMDSKAHTNSFMGIFFMALTLVLVSFSCTAAFIGNLLVDISQQKARLGPSIGFLGFSIAMALPFAFFAFFPGLLNKIAKSGGWLNTMKVTFGLIEIAMALKFLSNADLSYHWHFLNRDIYLSLWIIIFGVLGLYLLGKLKFSHDDALPLNDYGHPYIGIPRLLFAIISLAFSVYMIPGLWGAPLNSISGWLPENKTQEFNLVKLIGSSPQADTSTASIKVGEVKPKKYTDILQSEIPGVLTFFDFDEAVAAAKQMKKPLMLDFTGHSCANCRKMESEVLSQPEVSAMLKNDYVVASLYVDERTKLSEGEKYTSKFDSSSITTVGAKNLDIEAMLGNSNAQPLYLFADQEGKIIRNGGGYEPDIPRFINILKETLAENKKRFP